MLNRVHFGRQTKEVSGTRLMNDGAVEAFARTLDVCCGKLFLLTVNAARELANRVMLAELAKERLATNQANF